MFTLLFRYYATAYCCFVSIDLHVLKIQTVDKNTQRRWLDADVVRCVLSVMGLALSLFRSMSGKALALIRIFDMKNSES